MSKTQTPKPREVDLILGGSPCDTNFYPNGPRTVKEAMAAGRCICSHADKCKKGRNSENGFACIMDYAIQVARSVIKEQSEVHREVYGDFRRYFEAHTPKKGCVFSKDGKTFEFVTDKDEVLKKVEEFALQVLGANKPLGIGPSFADVVNHAMDSDGAVDLRKVDALEGRFGGRCDVRSGPCACGAWH